MVFCQSVHICLPARGKALVCRLGLVARLGTDCNPWGPTISSPCRAYSQPREHGGASSVGTQGSPKSSWGAFQKEWHSASAKAAVGGEERGKDVPEQGQGGGVRMPRAGLHGTALVSGTRCVVPAKGHAWHTGGRLSPTQTWVIPPFPRQALPVGTGQPAKVVGGGRDRGQACIP